MSTSIAYQTSTAAASSAALLLASQREVPATAHERDGTRHLQRSLGNRAFGAILQTKLRVNAPGDVYEQEADGIAERIGAIPFGAAATAEPGAAGHAARGGTSPAGTIHRMCASCAGEERHVQRSCAACAGDERREHLQRSAAGAAPKAIAPETANAVDAMRGGGTPLPVELRSHFEPHFGADFSAVRIHTDERAARTADSLNARAFTIGSDVAFGPGMYSPATTEGRKLLAHELTHVMQQSGGAGTVQRALKLLQPDTRPTYLRGPDGRRTRADLLERWLNKLCPDGNWKVDRSSGTVQAGAAEGFCAATATEGMPHSSTSAFPESCACLCNLMQENSKDVDIVIDQQVTAPTFLPPDEPDAGTRGEPLYTLAERTFKSGEVGEGFTLHGVRSARPNVLTVLSGRAGHEISGSGDSKPEVRGSRGAQFIRDDAWIILGHELCGHVLHPTPNVYKHTQTPRADGTAVDAENRIRHEHSTRANNYGTRRGEGPGRHGGSVVELRMGETVDALARRLGVPMGSDGWDSSGSHWWLFDVYSGKSLDRRGLEALRGGRQLYVTNVYYYDVMAGDTLERIASTWGVGATSIRRANPDLKGEPVAGMRLIIPAK